MSKERKPIFDHPIPSILMNFRCIAAELILDKHQQFGGPSIFFHSEFVTMVAFSRFSKRVTSSSVVVQI